MIFEEVEDGMEVWISDRELMTMENTHFIAMIMKARHIYRMHADADMDDDNSKEE